MDPKPADEPEIVIEKHEEPSLMTSLCDAALSQIADIPESDLKRNVVVNLKARAYRDQREIDGDLQALARM